jgi:hypothetical protein
MAMHALMDALIGLAAKANPAGIKDALGELESLSRGFLLFSGVILLAGGAVIAAGAWLVYAKKIRRVAKPSDAWRAALLGLAGLALITLLSGVLGILMFALTPFVIKELMGG